VRLGDLGRQKTGGAMPPEWSIGREGVFDSYLPDGEVIVWLEEPDDGWRMWIFDEDHLEAAGRNVPRLPDDPGDEVA
jgi:hypothetical protein